MWHVFRHIVTFADPVHSFQNISYLGIFLVVALSGHVLPLPEDAVMLLIGYVSALGVVSFPLAILVAVIAILFADFCLYYLSYTGAHIAEKIERRIKANIFTWYSDRMRARAFQYIFISRFIPGMRFVGPVVAGYVKISPLRYIFYAFCSAVIYVPLMITIGFLFHEKITPLISVVESTRHVVFIVALAVLAVAISVVVYRKLFTQRPE